MPAFLTLGVFFLKSQERTAVQADQAFFRVTGYYAQGAYSEVLTEAQTMLDLYGGRREGKWTLYYAGAAHLALAENDRLTWHLSRLFEAGGPRQQAICEGLASVRLNATPEELSAAAEEFGGFGPACAHMAATAAGLDLGDPKYVEAEAVRITLKLLTSEAVRETIVRIEAPPPGDS